MFLDHQALTSNSFPYLFFPGLDKTADSNNTPILILTCNSSEEGEDKKIDPDFDLDDLAKQLGLDDLDRHRQRPWAIFNVNIADMSGMTKALEWILYHIQKRKCDLEFHQSSSQQ